MKTGDKKEGRRALKRKVLETLMSEDLDVALETLLKIPGQKVVNALFSFLHSTNEKVKWAAVTAMGAVVAEIADEDMETARVIMRRLMWNLNDESGGIGWGSPEAMGEILACHEGLAEEYAHVLLSYAREDGNYLEYEMLQRGLLWGIGRLSQVRPHLVQDSAHYLIPYLEAGDTIVKGLAVWVIGILGAKEARTTIEKLKKNTSEIQIYQDRRIIKCQVKDLLE
ncbi:MAG: HEAT repeat domain-containing protein [Deltaproteobacteria bacterium]|nr:HEAT repeat domain-containing protein [Deltaproteobacteria bacterium]MBW2144201.1 HEAT repeat domain-containing protein [Deltaproteobacteria bacterium]